MSANLDLILKVAWTSKHPRKQINCYNENVDLMQFCQPIKEQPRNYCDDELDNIFNPRDWFEDTWWKPA